MWHDARMLNLTSSALFGAVLLAALSGALLWVAQRPMFAIRSIQVQGADRSELRHVNTSTIRSTALPRIRGNFFTANLDSVRAAFESVPWVRRAAVRREWPNRLIVTIEEHQPLGTWGDDGKLVSVKGEVFTVNMAEAEEDGELLKFSGPDGSEKEVVKRYDQLRAGFAHLKLTPQAVHLSNRYAWSARLNNGMTVEFGREQNSVAMNELMERLVDIYPELAARLKNRIESIDMRYPNGVALRSSGLVLAADGKQRK